MTCERQRYILAEVGDSTGSAVLDCCFDEDHDGAHYDDAYNLFWEEGAL